MFLISIIILTGVLVYITKQLINHQQLQRKIANIPGPPTWPLIGNGFYFLNKKPAELVALIYEFIQQYGTVVRIWVGTRLDLIVSNPEDIEVFLSSQVHIDKGRDYKDLEPWLNSGLLLSTGKKWKQRRKVLTPAFHFTILEQFVEIFEKQSHIFTDILSQQQNLNNIDLYPLITLYALDVICETAMGTVINAQRNSNSEYVQAVKEISHIISMRFFNIFLQYNFIFNLTTYGRRQKKILKILHNFTENVIQNRRKEITSNSHSADVIVDEFGTKKKMAFLDVLLKATIDGEPLTDQDVREEVDTFMFEGHDTTTSAITFILYNIAKYPEVQEKCYQEILSILENDKSTQFTYSDLGKLNYLEKVIKESLRLFPSVPIVQRTLREDVNINNRIYPAGVGINLHILAMGRNPKYFQDPLAFRPERFDIDNTKEFSTFAYVPFSAGPRNCIGQKFAMLEMKSIIAHNLKLFKFLLVDDKELVLCTEIVLRPETPIMFNVINRMT